MSQFKGSYDQYQAFLIGKQEDSSLRVRNMERDLQRYSKALDGINGDSGNKRDSGTLWLVPNLIAIADNLAGSHKV